jgi:hypothetical protein
VFSGDHDVIMDASVIHTLRRDLGKAGFDLYGIDLNQIVKATFFIGALGKLFDQFKDSIIMFDELQQEYHGIILNARTKVKELLSRFIGSTELIKDCADLKDLLEIYKTNLESFETSTQKLNRFTDKRTDVLEDLLVYVNQEFRIKDETRKTVDEKIIAAAILNSVLGKKTNLYTLDNGMLNLTKGFFYLMKSNKLLATRKICRPAKSFIEQLRKTDLNVFGYNRGAKLFCLLYENTKNEIENNSLFEQISVLFKRNKDEIAKAISDHIFEMYTPSKT